MTLDSQNLHKSVASEINENRIGSIKIDEGHEDPENPTLSRRDSQSSTHSNISDISNTNIAEPLPAEDLIYRKLGQRVVYHATNLTLLVYIMNLTPGIINNAVALPEELSTTSGENTAITSALPLAATTINFIMNRPNSDKRKTFLFSLSYSYLIESIWQNPNAVYSMVVLLGISHFMNNEKRPRLHDLSKRLVTTLRAATSTASDFIDKKLSFLMPQNSDPVGPD